jgi:hypothetical protein
MHILGKGGFKILMVGSEKIIQSVPLEFSTDHTTVIAIGQANGWVSASELHQQLQWTDARIKSVLVCCHCCSGCCSGCCCYVDQCQ